MADLNVNVKGNVYINEAAAGGWWLSGGISAANCIAAYAPKGAATYAASKINLANPGTYNAVDGAAYPTWNVATGWTFNGSTQYLTTGIIPTDAYTVIFRYANLVYASNNCIFGCYDSVTDAMLHTQTMEADKVKNRHGDVSSIYIDSAATTPNTYAIAGKSIYRAGGFIDVCVAGAAGGAYRPLYIGALNLDGSVSQYTAVDLLSMSFYDTTLGAPVVLAVSNAMAAL
jgi:hypothetical protein